MGASGIKSVIFYN
jgi:hypothetical protein